MSRQNAIGTHGAGPDDLPRRTAAPLTIVVTRWPFPKCWLSHALGLAHQADQATTTAHPVGVVVFQSSWVISAHYQFSVGVGGIIHQTEQLSSSGVGPNEDNRTAESGWRGLLLSPELRDRGQTRCWRG